MVTHATFSEFRTVTKKLDGQSEPEQIQTLTFALYGALERAQGAEGCIRSFEREHEALETEARQVREALARVQDDHAREVQALHDEIRSLEAQGAALDHLCRRLLAQIEGGGEDGSDPGFDPDEDAETITRPRAFEAGPPR